MCIRDSLLGLRQRVAHLLLVNLAHDVERCVGHVGSFGCVRWVRCVPHGEARGWCQLAWCRSTPGHLSWCGPPEWTRTVVGLLLFHPHPGRLPERPMGCLLYTSPSPRDRTRSRMPS